MDEPHSERSKRSPSPVESTHGAVALVGLVLAAGSWAGLVWLIGNNFPDVPGRWAFFALLQMAVTGTVLPVVMLIHQRFELSRSPQAPVVVLVRQAGWVGLLATSSAWLQVARLLSLPFIIILLIALIAVEALLRLREQSQWRPE